MANCVAIDADGYVVNAPTEPCIGLVLLTPAEYAHIASSPFNLSSEDGLALSAAIVGVWAAAYMWRAAVRTLNVNDGNNDND